MTNTCLDSRGIRSNRQSSSHTGPSPYVSPSLLQNAWDNLSREMVNFASQFWRLIKSMIRLVHFSGPVAEVCWMVMATRSMWLSRLPTSSPRSKTEEERGQDPTVPFKGTLTVSKGPPKRANVRKVQPSAEDD